MVEYLVVLWASMVSGEALVAVAPQRLVFEPVEHYTVELSGQLLRSVLADWLRSMSRQCLLLHIVLQCLLQAARPAQ